MTYPGMASGSEGIEFSFMVKSVQRPHVLDCLFSKDLLCCFPNGSKARPEDA